MKSYLPFRAIGTRGLTFFLVLVSIALSPLPSQCSIASSDKPEPAPHTTQPIKQKPKPAAKPGSSVEAKSPPTKVSKPSGTANVPDHNVSEPMVEVEPLGWSFLKTLYSILPFGIFALLWLTAINTWPEPALFVLAREIRKGKVERIPDSDLNSLPIVTEDLAEAYIKTSHGDSRTFYRTPVLAWSKIGLVWQSSLASLLWLQGQKTVGVSQKRLAEPDGSVIDHSVNFFFGEESAFVNLIASVAGQFANPQLSQDLDDNWHVLVTIPWFRLTWMGLAHYRPGIVVAVSEFGLRIMSLKKAQQSFPYALFIHKNRAMEQACAYACRRQKYNGLLGFLDLLIFGGNPAKPFKNIHDKRLEEVQLTVFGNNVYHTLPLGPTTDSSGLSAIVMINARTGEAALWEPNPEDKLHGPEAALATVRADINKGSILYRGPSPVIVAGELFWLVTSVVESKAFEGNTTDFYKAVLVSARANSIVARDTEGIKRFLTQAAKKNSNL